MAYLTAEGVRVDPEATLRARHLAEALAAYRAMGASGHARRVEVLLRD